MLPSDVDQYRVIDTDTHVIEPYDLWTSRLSVEKWGDKVPHVQWDERRQEDAWYFGDRARRRRGRRRPRPAGTSTRRSTRRRLDVVDPATWDARPRLSLMDEYGIWAQVLYPNVAGFGAGKVLAIGDPS